jgi:hypothetical protein
VGVFLEVLLREDLVGASEAVVLLEVEVLEVALEAEALEVEVPLEAGKLLIKKRKYHYH